MLLAAAVAFLALPGCGGDKATLATFAGHWGGHGKTLNITKAGLAREVINSGCCYLAVAMRFTLSEPHGTPRAAKATATVTAVRIRDRSWFSQANPAPRVGQSATVRFRDGVISETLTRANYCGPSVNWIAGGCGA
jgi:hypothetical protein